MNTRSTLGAVILSAAVAAWAALPSAAMAGVAVTENQDTTAWPGTPTIETHALPYTGSPAGESVTSSSGGHGRGQTFIATETALLDSVSMVYSTAAAGGTFQLLLQEVTDPNAASFTTGTNLLSSGLTFSYSVNTGGVLKVVTFDLEDADEVLLVKDKAYAWQIVYDSGSPFTIYRRGSDTYANGAAYTNNATTPTVWNAINYPSTRDFMMAITLTQPPTPPIPEPATGLLLALGAGVTLYRRRRQARAG